MASPEPAVVSIELAAGAEPIRLRLDTPTDADKGDHPVPRWTLESEPDWDGLEGIRLVSAGFDDGGALAFAAVRPRAAPGHGDDIAVARFIDAEDEETTTSDALLSVEYDAEGVPRRIGLEVWPEPDSAPLRVAANRDDDVDPRPANGREVVPMTFRLDGTSGAGLYEVLRGD
jgi:hypothetical protein